jgi:hypothetical protein
MKYLDFKHHFSELLAFINENRSVLQSDFKTYVFDGILVEGSKLKIGYEMTSDLYADSDLKAKDASRQVFYVSKFIQAMNGNELKYDE